MVSLLSINSLVKIIITGITKLGFLVIAVPLALTTFIFILPTMLLFEEVNRLLHKTA